MKGDRDGAPVAHRLFGLFSGTAILSGVPYNCAEDSLITALKRCTDNEKVDLPVDRFAAQIREGSAAGLLADPANLANDQVYLFHGTLDDKVSSRVHNATASLYAEFIPSGQIHQINDIAAGHVFPAMDAEHSCTDLVAPLVGDCDYDGAGELLGYLYPGLEAPGARVTTEMLSVDLLGAADADLMKTAYLFVPSACANGEQACALHLVLHGCAQSAESVGADFIQKSGYLPWAETNAIVLAFPQVRKSLIAPLNPHGCWDWWGYIGDDYANRNGRQMATLAHWINALQEKE